ncbi:hypothetical protein EB118_13415 [bacterium]|nr:hypothetical protein [bacterium]
MADVVTGTVTGFVNNYPEQTTASLSDIRLEQMKQASDNLDAVRDARHAVIADASRNTTDLSRQVDAIDDTLTAQLITLARDTQDIRAQVISAQQAMVTGFLGASKDAEINALKTQVELAKQSTYLSDKIDNDGEKTRALVNSLKEQELNRILIERNSELVEERFGRRFWHHGANQGQWAALNSQLQAFQSQLQETRQGMVNFGTMAGVGQTSTSNNVR